MITAKQIQKEFNSVCDKFKLNTSTPDELRSLGFYTQAELLETIKEFPLNKVISRTGVIKICEKYGLLLGEIERFCGHIPDKNIKEINEFKKANPAKLTFNISYYSFDTLAEAEKKQKELAVGLFKRKKGIEQYSRDGSYFICAPQNEFIIREEDRIVNKVIITDDPIVLFLPRYSRSSFVIVTAWGDEAIDEMVVNEKMN